MAKLARKVAPKKVASKGLSVNKENEDITAFVQKTPAQIEIAKLQREKREEVKRIDDRIRTIKLSEKTGDIEETWKKLEEIKKLVKDKLASSGLSGKYDLKKLANKVPDYYIYQHPTNKILKTNNQYAGWVVEYCKKGSIDTLIETANKGRNTFFVTRTTKTKKRTKKAISTSLVKTPKSGLLGS